MEKIPKAEIEAFNIPHPASQTLWIAKNPQVCTMLSNSIFSWFTNLYTLAKEVECIFSPLATSCKSYVKKLRILLWRLKTPQQTAMIYSCPPMSRACLPVPSYSPCLVWPHHYTYSQQLGGQNHHVASNHLSYHRTLPSHHVL